MTAAEHSGQQGPHPRPDPLVMSPGEKVAAEWEARHDVAARGSHGAPGAVQHYLAETRTREAQRAAAPRAATAPAAPAEPSTPPPPARRRWWLFGRRR